MSISDDLMWRYYDLLSRLPSADIAKLKADVASGAVHPKNAKVQLAMEIVARFHSQADAQKAKEEFDNRPLTDVPTVNVPLEGAAKLGVLAVAVKAGLGKSNGEVRRLIDGKGLSIDNTTVTDPKLELGPGSYLFRAGKHRHVQVVIQ
jgi:tyrosyl-tRNA synthetase